MHWYLVAFAVLAVTGLAGFGIATITTGWVPPWARRRVLRPKVWGYGSVLSAAGMSLFMFLGPFRGPDADMTPYAMTGLAMFLAGTVLQAAGQRPGRPAGPASR
ncbi:hypothetical protein [Streptomyces sp. NBC_01615]|uniref:hypothetical protein n=1 Tax=Streptomyces sp. NBC_01615 TaxID=2975898 RepID=UPI00386E8F9D